MTKTKPNNGIDIKGLLDRIDFSSDNVVAAAAENAPLFRVAIDYRIDCLRSRNVAKMAWEVAEAELELKLREDARLNGERITEGHIKALLQADAGIAEFHKKYLNSDELDEYSKLVVEAFRMRRDCLRIIGDLTPDDLSIQRALEAGGHAKIAATRKKLKDRFPGT